MPCNTTPHPTPPQALLNIDGTGTCTTAGTAAVQQSVLSYMQVQPGVNNLQVDVKCLDTTGGRRRLHQVIPSLLTPHSSKEAPHTSRFTAQLLLIALAAAASHQQLINCFK
jgi:hypothetical protein